MPWDAEHAAGRITRQLCGTTTFLIPESTLWCFREDQLLVAIDKASPGTRDSRYATDHPFGNLRIGCPRSIRVLVVDGSLPILK